MKHHFNAKFNVETEKEICRLYELSNENSCKVLAKKFHCNWTTILNIIKRHKIRPRTNSQSQLGLRIGEKSSNYKGGCTSSGYRRMAVTINNKRVYVQEHHYLMEQKIGRKLNSSEVVHHINGNKLDNRMENLQLTTRKEHPLLHDCAKNLPN